MKINRTILGIILVCFLLTIGCGGTAVNQSTPAGEARDDLIETSVESAEPTPSGYWNGGDYPERPVYSVTLGISQTAHNTFAACGLRDNAVQGAVEAYLQQNTERQMIMAQDSQKETMWSVAITVTSLTIDIYEVTCAKIES
jgi:hypothetical protein